MKFFGKNISVILTNIICFGEPEVVTNHGKEWGLKEIKQTPQACEFSFPTERNLFDFLEFCKKNKVGESYGVVMTIVLENGKLWYIDFSCFNDSNFEDEGEFDELVRVFKDMKEYYNG